MPRVYTFRGKTGEQLKKLTTEQYLQMITSRQRRAVKRMGLEYKQLITKISEAEKEGSTKPIRTQIREAVILPAWIGKRFAVHTGKEYKDIIITEEMLGHRLGEFAHTTKRVQHSAPGIRATRGSKFLAVK
ncbi:MAG: ribosomal protein S19 family protein [Candidatus Marsarchaeota archaeon]|jgi:small subunit ribosomal protein S19|nr:ribosomal protein S19 family protein [Candidatus Marsarchaeota archaeon]